MLLRGEVSRVPRQSPARYCQETFHRQNQPSSKPVNLADYASSITQIGMWRDTHLIPSVREEIAKLGTMIEPLKKRRNQMLAHDQLRTTLTDQNWKIAWAELEAAYSLALKLGNRVYKAYKGREAMLVVGAKESTISNELNRILHKG